MQNLDRFYKYEALSAFSCNYEIKLTLTSRQIDGKMVASMTSATHRRASLSRFFPTIWFYELRLNSCYCTFVLMTFRTNAETENNCKLYIVEFPHPGTPGSGQRRCQHIKRFYFRSLRQYINLVRLSCS